MTTETIQHASLTNHSSPFAPSGGTSYVADCQGSIVDGGVELQILQNGSFTSLNPPVRFTPFTVNGSVLTGIIPPGAVLRWTVPRGNNITTKIVSTHG
jgi:hypothetical protein